ncbi:hypothetical protein [Opitutus sp. ER46]|uniref:hypothetical protein n=1 Tax=Opitutus sp. ER46 TaxID=2161864 RepID=UPI000D2FE876|nr:hypothetical protein [Opitutus sp. ER46]PTX91775.1 hypothetical protein DB354_18125 [Opitutus sp. ER46]
MVPFRVFIGYADIAAARRATGIVGHVVRRAGLRVEIQPRLWRFAQLASSYWADRAVTAALDADLIVLAGDAPGASDPAIEPWINALLAAHRGRPTTIVSLGGENDAWTITLSQPPAPAGPPPELPAPPVPHREFEPVP